MTNTLLKWLEEVRLNSSLKSDQEVENFESVLAKIAELNDPDCIDELLLLLDDNTELHEVLFSIIHLVEAFSDEIYIAKLLSCLESFITSSREWAEIVHYRIFNSDSCFDVYLNSIYSFKGNKLTLVNFLNNIAETDQEFETHCKSLINNIDRTS